jgi:predicted metal-dependent TIM-barrel fold hydrolase
MTSWLDPHIHMISRVTDDYHRMAQCGCLAVSEPAFWAGFDRGSAAGFRDYFHHLTEVEPKRAALFGIRHYSWLCINAKEAENVQLSREVIAVIPDYLQKPNVLGIGEIGLNKNTANEATVFQEHVDLAMKTNELILIHTPHLEDKYKGTRMIVDMLKGDRRVQPGRVCIDHVEEHTVRLALDNGFWCGMTLYPTTKCTPQRACDILERYGTDHIMANSAGDWGKSDPLAVPELILEMRRRGHAESEIRKVVHDNPLAFFKQSKRWQPWPKTEADAETQSTPTNGQDVIVARRKGARSLEKTSK